jgi:hypothetical protein
MPKNHASKTTNDRFTARQAKSKLGDKDNDRLKEAAVYWAFGAFWAALNCKLEKDGYPEARFKAAREAWEAAQDTAKRAIRDYSANAMNETSK